MTHDQIYLAVIGFSMAFILYSLFASGLGTSKREDEDQQ